VQRSAILADYRVRTTIASLWQKSDCQLKTTTRKTKSHSHLAYSG